MAGPLRVRDGILSGLSSDEVLGRFMSNPETPETQIVPESSESFGDILSQFQKSHSHKTEGSRQLQATVIAVNAESVFLDIGYKSEGILPLAALQGETLKPGDKCMVTVKGRDLDGYYELSRFKVERPMDWTALEKAFADKSTVLGTVTGVIKGGFSVDVGVRAFMPASRSGVREAVEMEKLVGQEIRCRIIKLDVTDEDVVVDRRAVAEEEERSAKDRLFTQIKEGDTINGTVRSLTDYGAFVDLGGVDASIARKRHLLGTREQASRRAFGGARGRSEECSRLRRIPTSGEFLWA